MKEQTQSTDTDGTTGVRIARYATAAVAVGFGLLTLKSGGSVLFGSEEARRAAGDWVPFVVWFNFSAGFAYVAGGIGLAMRQTWARWLALALAVGSAITYVAFGIHILQGGAWEMRTVIAMALRTGFWAAVAVAAFWLFDEGC